MVAERRHRFLSMKSRIESDNMRRGRDSAIRDSDDTRQEDDNARGERDIAKRESDTLR